MDVNLARTAEEFADRRSSAPLGIRTRNLRIKSPKPGSLRGAVQSTDLVLRLGPVHGIRCIATRIAEIVGE
jgi:hypothetical protein